MQPVRKADALGFREQRIQVETSLRLPERHCQEMGRRLITARLNLTIPFDGLKLGRDQQGRLLLYFMHEGHDLMWQLIELPERDSVFCISGITGELHATLGN